MIRWVVSEFEVGEWALKLWALKPMQQKAWRTNPLAKRLRSWGHRALLSSMMALGLSGCVAVEVEHRSSSSAAMSSQVSMSSQASSSSEVASSSSAASSSSEPVVDLCAAPADMEITDIDSVTDWINAMPKPLTLACFLKSLPRPMYYNATLSTFSAQASVGRPSPRVFLMIGDLILTVVPDEKTEYVKDELTGQRYKVWDVDGVQLLELSFQVPTDLPQRQSIKAELKFPVTDTLPRNAPYDHIAFSETSSTCLLCHGDEVKVDEIDGVPVYRSEMLRNKRETEVLLPYMLNQYAICDPEANENAWYRCEMLEAIYGQGTLVWESFPIDMETIFEN